MNRLSLKLLFLAFVFLQAFQSISQSPSGNIIITDTLKSVLYTLLSEAKNEKLQTSLQVAINVYHDGTLTDTLRKKLHDVQTLLEPAGVNWNTVLRYESILAKAFARLHPQYAHPMYALSLHYLATALFKSGFEQQALPVFKQSLQLKRKVFGHADTVCANTLLMLGVLHVRERKIDTAFALIQEAVSIMEKIPLNPEYATCLDHLAYIYIQKGMYETALQIFHKSKDIREKTTGKSDARYALSLRNIAEIHSTYGEWNKSLPILQEAYDIVKRLPGEPFVFLFIQDDLAFVCLRLKQYDQALNLFRNALPVRKRIFGEQTNDYGHTLQNLSRTFRDTRQNDSALKYINEAIDILKKVNGTRHQWYANGISDLGIIYVETGKYEKALPLFREAVQIGKLKADSTIDYIWHLKHISSLHHKMGNNDSSEYYLKEAINIARVTLTEEHPDYAILLSLAASAYISTGAYHLAGPFLVQASRIELLHLFRTYSSLSEDEKLNLLLNEDSQFNLLPSLLFKSKLQDSVFNDQVFKNVIALKGMVMHDHKEVLKNIRQKKDPVMLLRYKQWLDNRAMIGKLTLHGLKKGTYYLDSLLNSTRQLEQQLSRSSVMFRNQIMAQQLSSRDISKKLKKGEAAIEFIRFNLYSDHWTDTIYYGALLLLKDDRYPRFIPLCEEKQVAALLDAASAHVGNEKIVALLYENKPGSENFHYALYKLLWQPLEAYLDNVQTIYYSPVALLNRIAFNAIYSKEKGLLIDNYHLVSLLSTRSLAMPEPVDMKITSAAIWGNIDYASGDAAAGVQGKRGEETIGEQQRSDTRQLHDEDLLLETRNYTKGGWLPLTGTKNEMDTLKPLFKKYKIPFSLFSGTAASEEAFKAMHGNSPQLLHIATHGFFLPPSSPKGDSTHKGKPGELFKKQKNSMFRSGLVLAGGNNGWKGKKTLNGSEDGILTAFEIAQLDLSNTQITVLSACETALGDLQGNEGVIGLQRAFKVAGVKQMIASLWKVADYPTMELMTCFYRNWINGQSTREALRNAQLKIKTKYTNPYYWAGFVIIE
jgi:CHAT domain-containing protein/tetratricopeptide (TPR) repeat protein